MPDLLLLYLQFRANVHAERTSHKMLHVRQKNGINDRVLLQKTEVFIFDDNSYHNQCLNNRKECQLPAGIVSLIAVQPSKVSTFKVYVRPALDREKNVARKKFGNAYTKTRLKKINWKKAYSSSSQSSQSQSSQSSSSSLTNMYITILKTNKR